MRRWLLIVFVWGASGCVIDREPSDCCDASSVLTKMNTVEAQAETTAGQSGMRLQQLQDAQTSLKMSPKKVVDNQSGDAANDQDTVVRENTAMTMSADQSALVPVANVRVEQDQVIATVISFGCTSAEDFTVEHAVLNNRCELSIIRTKPDFCKKAPMPVELSIATSIPDLCLQGEVVITNPAMRPRQNDLLNKRFK